MQTFKVYLRLQGMTFLFGLVGPAFLVFYFALQPDSTIKWMYWWGLFITAFDVLLALVLTEGTMKAKQLNRVGAKKSRTD